MRTCLFSLPLAALLFVQAIAASHSPAEPICRPIDGEPFTGQLVSINADWNLQFSTPVGQRRMPLRDVVYWGRLHDTADGTQVLLADGSLIVASGVRMQDEKLVLEARTFGKPEGFAIAGTTRLPLNVVRAIIFRMPLEPLDRDLLLKRILQTTAREDQIWLANGDVVGGTFTRLGPSSVAIKTNAGDIEIRPEKPQGQLMEKVAAMVFNPLLLRPERKKVPHVLVGFRDSSRLMATKIHPQGDEQAEFELVCGVTIASHGDINTWKEIDYLQPLGDVHYLTDLTPAEGSYRHTPLLNLSWPLGVDENVLSGRLRASESIFPRGLGMHAASRVAYALDKPYKRLQAELAIDESAGDRGSATFVVVTDAGGKYKIVYESPIVRGGGQPLAIEVDLTGAKRVVLAVKSADHGTELDRANWLNLRLVD